MYSAFFGFKKEPFHITPDPEFLYLSPSHKQALGMLVYGVEKRMGFIEIIGDVGLGKTTILRAYLEKIHKGNITTIVILYSHISYEELLRLVFREVGLDSEGLDTLEMQDRFHHFLFRAYRVGRKVVLIIDEAQNLLPETLKQLQMLSNLETDTDKLLQIVLVGQTELEALLNRPELRQVKQRIAVRAELAPLTYEESRDYIRYRLSKVLPRSDTPIFTRMALRRIAKYSRGIPRKINITCDNALITALGYQRKPVTLRIVNEVIKDFEGTKLDATPGWSWKRWAFASVIVLLPLIGLWLSPYRDLIPREVRRLYPFLQQSTKHQPGEHASKTAATNPVPPPGPDVPPMKSPQLPISLPTPPPAPPAIEKPHANSKPLSGAPVRGRLPRQVSPSPASESPKIDAVSSVKKVEVEPKADVVPLEKPHANSEPPPGAPVSGRLPRQVSPSPASESPKIDAVSSVKKVEVEPKADVVPQTRLPAPQIQRDRAIPAPEPGQAANGDQELEKAKQGRKAVEEPDPARIFDRILNERASRRKSQ
jgi:general secretion pathway protein A